MHDLPLLGELAIITGVGVLVAVSLARLRLPTVAGLLFAGALIGPHAFGLVHSADAIKTLAEVGVVFMLFSVGLEFSLDRMRLILRQVLIGGSIQVGITLAATAGVVVLLGRSFESGVFFGCVVALSSTAIVLRALSERRELDAPHGRFIMGVLVFQDLCVVPMVLLLPLLAQEAGAASIFSAAGLALGKAALIVAATILVARLVVPRVLASVDASRSREVFILAVLALCIGTAWLTSLAGLSLALGAFLGGLVVADTVFRNRAMGDILPLRDVFVSIFFVSLGMLFEPRVIVERPLTCALLLAAFLGGKLLLATVAALAMRFPPRAAWLAGVALAQFGEFGFVLARLGESAGVVPSDDMAALLAAGVVSMFLTPVLMRTAPRISAGERLLAPLARLLNAHSIDQDGPDASIQGHVVIVGYGLAGRLAAASLSACRIPYVVLELNAESVRAARQSGEPVYYADATSCEALAHARAERASAIVLLINDPQAVERIVDAARRAAPDIPILVRTRYIAEIPALVATGAADVVAEELEAGIELLARLLRRLGQPRNVIDARIRDARQATQPSERKPTVPRRRLPELAALDDLKIEYVRLGEQSVAAGHTLAELAVRQKTRVSIVAVRRAGVLLDPEPDDPLQPGDLLFLVGGGEALRSAVELLDGAVGEAEPSQPAT